MSYGNAGIIALYLKGLHAMGTRQVTPIDYAGSPNRKKNRRKNKARKGRK